MDRLFISMAGSALILIPSAASAQCNGSCGVGALGQGGASSGGQAQGFYYTFPSTIFPGEKYSNSGNFDSGRLSITNQGSTAGTGRNNIVRGNSTGIFGDWSGQCSFEDFEAGLCD